MSGFSTAAACLFAQETSSLWTSPAFWEILIILLLTLANGFFAAAEIAIITARRGRLQQMAEEGDRAAKIALYLANNPDRFLPAVQVGVTLVVIFNGTFGGAQLVQHLESTLAGSSLQFIQDYRHGLAVIVVTLSITVLQLFVGELVPKRWALSRAESFARRVAPFLDRLAKVTKPLVWTLGWATNATLAMLQAQQQAEPSVSLDDIEHMIDTGTAEGVLKPVEQRVAIEALRLGERTVRDIMRPRIDLDAIDVNTPSDEVLGSVAMAGFSRLPVYENDLDHIIGFVHIKDLFRQHYLGWSIQLRKMMHPPLFVPETMTLDRLLHLFQERHNQLAIVLDEYGGTEGMVTLEDVIEELVGEIHDEHHGEADEPEIVERDDHSWLVDGQVSLDDVFEHLKWKDSEPNEQRGFSTISGLILDVLGRIPTVGDKAHWNGMTLEVVDMDGQRIERVLIAPQTPSAPPSQKP